MNRLQVRAAFAVRFDWRSMFIFERNTTRSSRNVSFGRPSETKTKRKPTSIFRRRFRDKNVFEFAEFISNTISRHSDRVARARHQTGEYGPLSLPVRADAPHESSVTSATESNKCSGKCVTRAFSRLTTRLPTVTRVGYGRAVQWRLPNTRDDMQIRRFSTRSEIGLLKGFVTRPKVKIVYDLLLSIRAVFFLNHYYCYFPMR